MDDISIILWINSYWLTILLYINVIILDLNFSLIVVYLWYSSGTISQIAGLSIIWSFNFRWVWQWLRLDSWWDWIWIQWFVWRLEKTKSTRQWRNQLTAHTTMKWVVVSRFISDWAKSVQMDSLQNSSLFQYFVFDFHVPPDVMFDKILKLSVSCLSHNK